MMHPPAEFHKSGSSILLKLVNSLYRQGAIIELELKKLMKSAGSKTRGLNIQKIRREFPMLQTKLRGKSLIYLDSAASGQKPNRVLEKLWNFYTKEYAKPKEEHELSKKVTKELEETRSKLADFLNASSSKEIIFSRGCTEAINMVALSFERSILKRGDEILITELEHHSNLVPWQMACERTGAKLRVAPITSSGVLDMQAFEKMLTSRTKLVAISHSSHVLGTILPVKQITKMAHKRGIPVMVDGAQAAPHMAIDLKDLDCDFYTFSGHKMGSPSGVGVLYGKKKWLDKLPPAEGGGDMTKKVSFEKSEYLPLPEKMEAGTMPFGEIIAFGVTIDYLNELGMEKVQQYELDLLHYATEKLLEVKGLKIYGSAPEKEPVISFSIKGVKPKDLEKYLSDEHNINIRSGDLSAQPLMKVLGVKELVRISLCFYNTFEEIDYLVKVLKAYVK
jgi:cysteine desulfurase / selenocysteine lyase